MGQELMNTTAFKGGPSAAFKAELDPNSESLSDGIGGSYAIINYKGKVWSLRYRGEKHMFVKDDGYPLEYLDLIILQQAQVKSKSYFPNYEEGSDSPPLCASIDGIVPDVGVPQKQAGACALCPRNVWKNSPDGKKIRECQDYKRIAVLLMPAQTKKLLGEALLEPVFLRIPGASLQGLALMGDETARQGYHFSSYITRVDFDPAQSYPKMRFKAIQPLTDTEAPVVLPLRKDPIALRIIGLGEQRPALAAPSPSTPVPAPQPAPPPQRVETGLTAAPAPATTPVKPTPSPTPSVAPATAPATQEVLPPQQQKAPSPPTQGTDPTLLVDTGLGGATPTTSTAAPPQAAQAMIPAQTSDTGPATDADAALDARIAALMPS